MLPCGDEEQVLSAELTDEVLDALNSARVKAVVVASRPCFEILVAENDLARVHAAFARITLPADHELIHFSGLILRFHTSLPVSVSLDALWERSPGTSWARLPGHTDLLGLSTLYALLCWNPYWAVQALELLGQSEPWQELKDSGFQAAVGPLAMLRYKRRKTPAQCRPDALARDLLVRRIARRVGIGNLPAKVGWLETLRFAFLPSLEYMVWSYRIQKKWTFPIYYLHRLFHNLTR